MKRGVDNPTIHEWAQRTMPDLYRLIGYYGISACIRATREKVGVLRTAADIDTFEREFKQLLHRSVLALGRS